MLSDPSAFAVCVLDVFWPDEAHLSEGNEVQARALDKLLEASLSNALGEQDRRATQPFRDERNLASQLLFRRNFGG